MNNTNNGSILVSVLWVVLILSFIVWGLGRRSAMEVSVMETYRGKFRSYAAARAGLNTVLNFMEKSPSSKDTLYNSGIGIEKSKTPESVFSHIKAGPDAYAVVQWPTGNFGEGNVPSLMYGLQDEHSRINVNAIDANNYQILSALFALKGVPAAQADNLAMAVVAFRGAGTRQESNEDWLSSEANDAKMLKPKRKAYEHLAELLDVKGMTQQIFDKVKNDLTVYGDTAVGLWVNMLTANNDVVQALANAAGRLSLSVDTAAIVRQAYACRDGADERPFTEDDGASTFIGNPANWPPALRDGKSSYLRARVVGIDKVSGARSVIEAVLYRPPIGQTRIIAWHRD